MVILNISEKLVLEIPELIDGIAINELISNSPPLDTNSLYCNFLQCGHFANTSIVAKLDGNVVGFISGYIVPERPETLFIWQVAIDKQARGLGLATRMLLAILSRPVNVNISFVETTITPDNQASWSLFRGLAKKLSCELTHDIWLDKQTHFRGEHESESLLRIGPFNVSE